MNGGGTEALFERAVGVLDPLDRARGALFSAIAPVARPLLRDRGLRVVTLGCISMTLSFALTWFFPMALLALGPLVLGVPHLLADVRYLVARPGLHRRAVFWPFVVLPLAFVYARPQVWVGLVAAMGAVAIARTTLVRKALALALLSLLAVFAYQHRGVAEVWMAHAHNLIALGMWSLFFRARTERPNAGKRRHAIVLALFALFTALLFLLPLPLREAAPFAGLEPRVQSLILSPFSGAALSLRFVLFFAFAQSVHYAVWVRSVPDEARPREGIRSFASSMRALRVDVGAWVLLAFVVTFLFLAGWALHDLVSARLGYLRLAISHGYLELAVSALFLLERRRGVESPASARA